MCGLWGNLYSNLQNQLIKEFNFMTKIYKYAQKVLTQYPTKITSLDLN